MANKIVKYQLEGGRIPSWIEDGGYYPDPSKVMIGATVDGSSEVGLGELASEADVKTYLDTYTSSWTEPDNSSDDPSATVPFATSTIFFTPRYSANLFSSSLTNGPLLVIHPLAYISSTYFLYFLEFCFSGVSKYFH